MGTNYYAIEDECPHCKRHERRHICKSRTSFQGHFTEDTECKPVPFIVSWQGWKDYLRHGPVDRIEDEYGHVHKVEDFIAAVESTSAEARRRQHDWMVQHDPARTGRVAEDCDWLDADGFSFYGGSFS